MVDIVSNGSAVLVLGDLGPLASKPVIEEKQFYLKDLPILTEQSYEINLQKANKHKTN